MSFDLPGAAIFLTVLLFSMSIHEMMHAYTSHWLGDDTAHAMGRVTLNPIKHIDPFFTVALPLLLYLQHSPFLFGAAKPVQVNFSRLKYGEFGGAIVGMIGPLTNIIIAIVAAALFNIIAPIDGTTTYEIFKITIVLNVGLAVFNSIPWPPLDGSRLLYAFAPRPLQNVMESIEDLGMIGLVVFIFIFLSLGGTVGVIMTKVVYLLAPNLII
jgi:Zn-dependent protease